MLLTPLLKDSWKSFLMSQMHKREAFFTYGRPDESCGSFTLMYFSKYRASRINLF